MNALPSPSNQLHHIDTSSLDVYKALSDLDPTKAFGCDNVHPRVLKHCAVALTEPITHLCDSSIKNQCIPDEWKLHKICPIPKKGDLTLVKNYRPTTLLPIVSKVLERIVYNKIIPFIRPLLSEHQFGLLKNRSCLKQLLVSFAQIFHNVNQGLQTDAIYFDFQKAFDSISHPELLFKLWAKASLVPCGVGLNPTCLIVSILCNTAMHPRMFFLCYQAFHKVASLVHCCSLFSSMTFRHLSVLCLHAYLLMIQRF